MMLKLTEHVGITINFSFRICEKPDEILIFRTFIAKFWIFEFSPILRKISQFSGQVCFYDVITT